MKIINVRLSVQKQFKKCSSRHFAVTRQSDKRSLLIFSQSDDLDLHSRSQLCLKVDSDKLEKNPGLYIYIVGQLDIKKLWQLISQSVLA